MLSYLLASADKKTQMLFDLAAHDEVFAPLVDSLHKTGYTIKHSYWGRPGTYIPQSNKTAPAKFRFSYRHGFSIVAHNFLHELVHYKQDQDRTLPTPQTVANKSDYINKTLNCEAEAEAQAIAASWRLKQAGHPEPWHGAITSFDWRGLAKAYEQDINANLTEAQAHQNCLKNWHTLPQHQYYKRRAEKIFTSHNRP